MDYYDVLGVKSTASLVEIRKAYIEASLKFHPGTLLRVLTKR